MKRRTLALFVLLLPLVACGQDNQTEDRSPQTAETAAPATALSSNETADPAADEDIEATENDTRTDEPPLRVAQTPETPAPTSPVTAPAFEEGVHYRLLTPTQPTSTSPNKVEVVEIFSYGCPHCFSFDPYVKFWIENNKPANVEFTRIAPRFRPEWTVYARAYYTAEVLGALDRLHSDIFNEIHVNRNYLQTEDAMATFFAEHGVDEETFRETYNSYAVNTRLRKASVLAGRYRANSVPTVVINGKYTTGPELTGGYEGLMQVMDYLARKELNRE